MAYLEFSSPKVEEDQRKALATCDALEEKGGFQTQMGRCSEPDTGEERLQKSDASERASTSQSEPYTHDSK